MAEQVTLDLDVGNTRTKWRLSRAGSELSRGAFDRSRESDLEPFTTLRPRPSRIRISSVASASRNESLSRVLEREFSIPPQFAKPTMSAGGVTCAYDDASRLGVDRWLAMLAARQKTDASYSVADLGTAATLDFVRAGGKHEGGFIVPGLRSMTNALLTNTAEVRVSFDGSQGRLAPGVDTTAAVQNGVLSMLVDFLATEHKRFEDRIGASAVLMCCGGDADLVSRHISVPHRVVADLVLEGLAIALP